jgi:hypothetical protein
MTADLAMMPAWQLVKLYKARKASPVEAPHSGRLVTKGGSLSASEIVGHVAFGAL